jgi:hypothetical protein
MPRPTRRVPKIHHSAGSRRRHRSRHAGCYDHLGKIWGQQTILVNQPGAGGAIAARTVVTAPPDGYSLYMAIASTFTALPEICSATAPVPT